MAFRFGSVWSVIEHPTPQYGQTESTAFNRERGISGAAIGLWVRAPVGQTAAHSPHETQLDLPIGVSRSKAIRAVYPFPVRPITSLCWISSQALTQPSHRIQAAWSTAMTG